VEASDALRRLVWRHRWLIVICALIPVAIVVPLRLFAAGSYAGTSTIQAQSAQPQVPTQSQAILSTVSAVATSPEVVRNAITAAHAGRNPGFVARHRISASSVGSSAIVALTVTDRSRAVATRLAAALAVAVVRDLNRLAQSSVQLSALTKQEHHLTRERGRLLARLAGAQGRFGSASPQVTALLNTLTGVESQLSAIITARQQAESTVGVDAGAAVVSTATRAVPVRSQPLGYGALALLLGLVIGLLAAAGRELARPTVAEPAAGARELGVPLLGNVQLTGDDKAEFDGGLPARLRLAAGRTGARTVALTGPIPPDQLAALATRLDEAVRGRLGAGRREPRQLELAGPVPPRQLAALAERRAGRPGSAPAAPANGDRPASSERPAGVDRPAGGEPAEPGHVVVTLSGLWDHAGPDRAALVVVLDRFAPHAAVDEVTELAAATGWPVLGVIGLHRQPRPRHATTRPGETTAGKQAAPGKQAALGKQAAPGEITAGEQAAPGEPTAGEQAAPASAPEPAA